MKNGKANGNSNGKANGNHGVLKTKNDRKNSVWDDPRMLLIQTCLYEGFTHATTAKTAKMKSVGYRVKLLGISTVAVRNGLEPDSQRRLEEIENRFASRIIRYDQKRAEKAKSKKGGTGVR